MAFDQERMGPELSHRVVLEDRSRLTVSGVEEVERFDENTVVLSTAQEGLHIEKLSLDGGDLQVEGTVTALLYDGERESRGGLFSRLLGG